MEEDYICYSLSYEKEEDIVRICEFAANYMPSHAAISKFDYCVSHDKNIIFHIAEVIFPDKKIDFIPREE